MGSPFPMVHLSGLSNLPVLSEIRKEFFPTCLDDLWVVYQLARFSSWPPYLRLPLNPRYRRATAPSRRACRNACHPGMPLTPPPACVAHEPWYSPRIGVR